MLFSRMSSAIRRFSTSTIRRSGHYEGGIPGENMPFDTDNLAKFTVYFGAFITSGIATPFLLVRHQLVKH